MTFHEAKGLSMGLCDPLTNTGLVHSPPRAGRDHHIWNCSVSSWTTTTRALFGNKISQIPPPWNLLATHAGMTVTPRVAAAAAAPCRCAITQTQAMVCLLRRGGGGQQQQQSAALAPSCCQRTVFRPASPVASLGPTQLLTAVSAGELGRPRLRISTDCRRRTAFNDDTS